MEEEAGVEDQEEKEEEDDDEGQEQEEEEEEEEAVAACPALEGAQMEGVGTQLLLTMQVCRTQPMEP